MLKGLEALGIFTGACRLYCCDAPDFYIALLVDYSRACNEKMQKIEEAYGQERWPAYAVLVHALKSTSGTIGAQNVSEQARRLEEAAKSKDVDFVHENHRRLMAAYEKMAEDIAATLRTYGKMVEEE